MKWVFRCDVVSK